MSVAMSGKALRDYFAAEAMNALIGAIPRDDWALANAESLSNIAENAFGVADAMYLESARRQLPQVDR